MNSNATFQLVQPADGYPYFHLYSHHIHLPGHVVDDLHTSRQAQHKFFHEHTHLVQTQTTPLGIYNFAKGVIGQAAHLFSLVSQRNTIGLPLDEWSKDKLADPVVKTWLDAHKKFAPQLAAAQGNWRTGAPTGTQINELFRATARLSSDIDVERFHIARPFNNEVVGVPVLQSALSEAQAECVGQRMSGLSSELWQRPEPETDAKYLPYTTVPAFVRGLFPEWELNATVFFLCDFALSTFSPDQAFVSGVEWLKDRPPPRNREEWIGLRENIEADIDSPVRSYNRTIEVLDEGIDVYSKRDDQFSEAIVMRFQQMRIALDAKRTEKLLFYPRGSSQSEYERIFEVVPAPRVVFEDGVRCYGTVEQAMQEHLGLLAAFTHIHGAFLHQIKPKCWLYDFQDVCVLDRVPMCAVAPWIREPVNDEHCEVALLGAMIGLDKIVVEP